MSSVSEIGHMDEWREARSNLSPKNGGLHMVKSNLSLEFITPLRMFIGSFCSLIESLLLNNLFDAIIFVCAHSIDS